MTLLSSVGMFGLGTLLIGDLPARKDRAGLISAAVLASGFGALILALAFVLVAPLFSTHFEDIAGSAGRAALLCAGVALTTMSAVFDCATIGLMRGGLQLARNMTFAVAKMLTLVVAALFLHYTLGIEIFLSWVAAIPVSLLVVAVRLWLTRQTVLHRPDWSILKSLGKAVAAHNWLNLALAAPGLLLPVLVASILSPSVNAGFYAAWTICNVLYILPTHLSTALFAVASGDHQAIAGKLRFTLRVSLLLGIPAMIILGFGAHLILGVYGAGYSRVAAVPMELLVIGYLPAIPNFFYIAVCRALGKISRAAALLTAFAALDVAASVIGCLRGGLIGLTAAGLAVGVIEALVTAPTVIRAAFGSGRHRRMATQINPAPVTLVSVGGQRILTAHHAGSGIAQRARQQAGIALLLSMATPVPLVRGSTVGTETKSRRVRNSHLP
jgi:O-antigen/teichoic acid export membrane protein